MSDVILEFSWGTEMSDGIQDTLEKLDLDLHEAAADLGVAPVSWEQSIVNVEAAPAREAGEVVEDDGEAYLKIVSFLEGLKVI